MVSPVKYGTASLIQMETSMALTRMMGIEMLLNITRSTAPMARMEAILTVVLSVVVTALMSA